MLGILIVSGLVGCGCVFPEAWREQVEKCRQRAALDAQQQAAEDAAIVAHEVGWWRAYVATTFIP